VRYDLVGDEISATNTFTGGGNSFQTDGLDAGRLTLDAGAGVTYHTTTNWSVKAEYNFQGKEDFTSHSALVRAGYKF
jgi:opacity protein-like surface antigen